MKNQLIKQYEFSRDSHPVVVGYCQTKSVTDFSREVSDFDRGRIRNLLVHTVHTHESWPENFGLPPSPY